MPENSILVLAKLSSEKESQFRLHLRNRIKAIEDGSKVLRTEKLIKWRASYEARPREEVRMFPFQNASNLVIPIIAIHADTLHARIMSGIFKTQPLWVAKLYGDESQAGGELKEAYQEFMQYVGIEPQELDLYRVYNEWMLEIVKYGTSTIKIPWEKKMRDFLLPLSVSAPLEGYSATEHDFLSDTFYEGPRPEKLPFESFGIPPTAKTLDSADIKYHKRVMLRHELEERKFSGVYDSAQVDKILKTPDRHHTNETQSEAEESLGSRTSQSYGHQEWDVYECYLQWRYDQDKYAPRMIATYHEKSDTLLRTVYDNFKEEWFVGGRMAHRDDSYYGYGFAEILWPFQEEASEKHNGRNDNQTVANTRVWRVSPDSKLHQGYRIYPSAMLPAEEGEIEPLVHGEISSTNMDEERLTLELAERRSGVSPPQQGFGAGTMSGKRGVYSAMGTLSLLQEGNRRTDLTLSDMRDAHVRLGRIVSLQYKVFGDGSKFNDRRLALFKEKGKLIQQALAKLASHEMGLPVYAATASVNKEIEKQNDIMMAQIMARHYQMISQLLMMMEQMQAPPAVKEYASEVIDASNFLMRSILRNFGYDETMRLVPDPLKKAKADLEAQEAQKRQQSQAPPQGPPQAGGPTNGAQRPNPQPGVSNAPPSGVPPGTAIQ